VKIDVVSQAAKTPKNTATMISNCHKGDICSHPGFEKLRENADERGEKLCRAVDFWLRTA
jgi:hypothetical protein